MVGVGVGVWSGSGGGAGGGSDCLVSGGTCRLAFSGL